MRHSQQNKKYDGPVKISTLFEKYRTRLRPPQGVVVTAFCAVIESELDIRLSTSSVRYNVHTRTIGVTAGGPQKSEILFNRSRILALCRDTLGPHGAPQTIV